MTRLRHGIGWALTLLAKGLVVTGFYVGQAGLWLMDMDEMRRAMASIRTRVLNEGNAKIR